MNNFQEMWDFDVREGVDFLHCNRVHPLMQTRVQNLLKEFLMSFLPKEERLKCSIFEMNCYYIMFEKKLKRQENSYGSEVRPVKTES